MTSHSQDKVQVEPQIDLADRLKDEGRLDEALPLYLRVIDANPKNVRALLQLSSIYEIEHEWGKAIGVCQQVLELQPENVAACVRLGCALQHQGNLDDAIPAYQRALELQPEQPPKVYLDFANILIERDRIDDAIEVYEQAIAFRPQMERQLRSKLNALLAKQRREAGGGGERTDDSSASWNRVDFSGEENFQWTMDDSQNAPQSSTPVAEKQSGLFGWVRSLFQKG